MEKQTAGREALGEFAPKFAQLNDDVLFGEVWSREDKLSLRDRSLITVTALMTSGMLDSSFKYHLETAKKNGITRTEITEGLRLGRHSGWRRKCGRTRKLRTSGKGTAGPGGKLARRQRAVCTCS